MPPAPPRPDRPGRLGISSGVRDRLPAAEQQVEDPPAEVDDDGHDRADLDEDPNVFQNEPGVLEVDPHPLLASRRCPVELTGQELGDALDDAEEDRFQAGRALGGSQRSRGQEPGARVSVAGASRSRLGTRPSPAGRTAGR